MSVIPNIESLGALSAFVTTVDSGGFAAAGRRLGLSPSAVGKAVSRLETRLGVRLLNRTTRSVIMTLEGEMLHARAARLLDDLRDVDAVMANARRAPVGRVRVSLPATLGRMVIVPALAAFLADYPGVDLDVGLDDRKVDIIEEGYDLAIRTGNLADSSLVGRKIVPHRFVLCASPAYLAAHGTPQSTDDLAAHRCLRFRYPTTGLLEKWSLHGRELDRELPTGPSFNDGEAVILAAIAGLGVAQVPVYGAATAIREGRLTTLLPDAACSRGNIWLLRPPNRTNLPRIDALATFLCDLLAGND